MATVQKLMMNRTKFDKNRKLNVKKNKLFIDNICNMLYFSVL